MNFNPFLANAPILYLLKTPENLWFSGVLRGYKMGTLARNGISEKWSGFKQTNTSSNLTIATLEIGVKDV